jgi:16S rRNA (cytosine967-C5)-methyltransferase
VNAFSFLYCTVSRYHSHLNTAVTVINEYTGEEPLANYLKKFFGSNKKYGSKDRKQISHLCYCYYRATRVFTDMPVEEKVLAALFLCSNVPNEILNELKPGWNEKALLNVEEKISELSLDYSPFSIHQLFPFTDDLSEGIDADAFAKSFLIQPDLFLRIRPGYKEAVLKKLKVSGLKFNVIGESCIALPNNTKIDGVVEIDKEAVVQDYSSQRVGEMLQTVRRGPSDRVSVWDCCAASGGKSILAKDVLGDIDLTVSDIRESILANLKTRFTEAGIKNYHSFITDLSSVICQLPTVNFHLIIADVPCTGSGTWSRTPEQLYFFNHQTIEQFNHLQKKIVSNAVGKLKPGGHLLYITCSVFMKENEEVVEFIQQQLNLQLIKKEVLIGYDKKAGTMFAALLHNPL